MKEISYITRPAGFTNRRGLGRRKVITLIGGGIIVVAIALAVINSGMTSPSSAVQLVDETPSASATAASGEAPTPREDCEKGWEAYDDPDGRFSFCYPEDYRLSTDSRHEPSSFGVLAGVYPLDLEGEGFAVWFQWVAVSHSDLPVNSLCTAGGGKYPFTSRNETTRTLLNATREVCYTDTFRDASKTELDYRSLALELPSTGSGVIRIRADFRPVEAEARLLEVIGTLRVR